MKGMCIWGWLQDRDAEDGILREERESVCVYAVIVVVAVVLEI